MKKSKLSEKDKDFLFLIVAMSLMFALGSVIAFELGWL